MANNNILIFIACATIVTSFLIYFLFLRKPAKGQYKQPSRIRINRQARGEDQCCICLEDSKKFQVSITCGHSFCGKCLLGLHEHSNEKLKCPLCRDDINVIFKVFSDQQQPKQVGRKIYQKIRQYNHKFDDDRSFLRRLSEFPFVLKAVGGRLFTMEFIRYFFSTANLMKMVITMIAYFISPIDLLPELLLGPAGYLDDVGFFIIVFLYTVANTAVQFVRNRE